MSTRLANALYDSFFGRSATTGYYRDLIDASPATARNDLQAAAAARLLAAVGATRGRRYEPGDDLLPALVRSLGGDLPAERPAIMASLAMRAQQAFELSPSTRPADTERQAGATAGSAAPRRP